MLFYLSFFFYFFFFFKQKTAYEMRISDWSSDVCSSDLNTYGTGCFMLMHTGSKFQVSQNGLVTTSAAQTGAQTEYAMEGSAFVAGAVVQRLRDGLGAFKQSSEIEALEQSVPNSGGLNLVPAFTGLGAHYRTPWTRAQITGLTR